MSKWIRNLALAGVFAVSAGTVVTVSGPSALAQAQKQKDKAKAADPVKPEEPKKAEAKGSLVIKPDAKGKFRVYVKDDANKVLFMSTTGGETEKEAREMLEEIKSILATAKVTLEKADKEK